MSIATNEIKPSHRQHLALNIKITFARICGTKTQPMISALCPKSGKKVNKVHCGPGQQMVRDKYIINDYQIISQQHVEASEGLVWQVKKVD